MTQLSSIPIAEELTLASAVFPVGMIMPWAGGTEPGSASPTGWLLCDGRTLDSVANTKYAALFTLIGTTYGGTGASAFSIPDLRGRTLFGADDMATTRGAANRLKNGAAAAARGYGAGSQLATITAAQLPPHQHGGSTAMSGALNHVHSGTTGGENQNLSHSHAVPGGGFFVAAGGSVYAFAAALSFDASRTSVPTYGLNSVWASHSTTEMGGPAQAHTHNFSSGNPDWNLSHQHTITTDNGPGSSTGHDNMPPFLVCNYLIKF